MRLTSGTKLGPYEIIDALGAGGMGEVYRARDPRLRRDVAIKVIQHAEADRATWERFEREARAASALSHPNICTVFDTGEADGQPYLVMELLEGQTLKDRIGGQPMESNAAVEIAVQIAGALEAAHGKGLLHRDIKPGNVMLVGRGHVKVLDFGLAKQTAVGETDETLTMRTETQAGTVMGTPAYLAPEVLQGAKADARSDLWALGVVLYQMLSGRLPFRGATTLEVSSGILKEAPAPLPANVPRAVRAIVERCLEKKPERRFQQASALLEELKSIHKQAAPAPRRVWLWVAGLAAVGIMAATVLWQQRSQQSSAKLSNGAPASAVQEANEYYEMGLVVQRLNDLPKAQALYAQALAADPHFAEAARNHAFNYVLLFLNGYNNDTGLLYKAEEELRQASAEVPDLFTLPSAQTALYMARGRRDLVPIDALHRVLEEHPAHPESAIWNVILLTLNEEDERAVTIAQEVLKRVPTLGALRMFLADIHRTQGDVSGAVEELKKTLAGAPDNISAVRLLALAYLDQGDDVSALMLLEEKRALFETNFIWRHTYALALAAAGQEAAAKRLMDDKVLDFARGCYVVTEQTAEFYGVLGDKDKAIEWLELAVRNGDERVGYFQRVSRLASVRADPRFRQRILSVEARRASR